MTTTWICPDISATEYFTEPFENLLIKYIYDKWSLTDPKFPEKPDSMQGADEDIHFRPGYLAEQPTYQILAIQRQTERDGPPLMIGQTSYSMLTTCEVLVRMKRLVSANADEDEDFLGIDPELWNMEQEVLRIVGQYGQSQQ